MPLQNDPPESVESKDLVSTLSSWYKSKLEGWSISIKESNKKITELIIKYTGRF